MGNCNKKNKQESLAGIDVEPKKKKAINILLVGDEGVGKKRRPLYVYCKGEWAELGQTTLGTDFLSKEVEIDGTKVNLQLWDTAGQERFRTITASFYRNADAVAIYYSIAETAGLETCTKWFQEVSRYTNENVPIVLVGNKLDLAPEKRKVTTEEGKVYADDMKVEFFEISAKSNNGLSDLFYGLGAKAFARRKNNTSVNNNSNNSNK